jgi:D-alanyl-D-alanine carboxypeptidase
MGSTIAERYVRAKTGTLLGASCLSGVAGAPGQRPVVFSLLMNDLTNPADARAAQDRASELLVWYLDPAAKPPAVTTPAAPTAVPAAAGGAP